MKANHINSLKHINMCFDHNDASNTRVYLYYYDVKILNPIVTLASGYTLTSFMCNSDTKYKEEMYDYSEILESLIKDQISLDEIDEIVRNASYKFSNVKEYRLKNVTPEIAQLIINRNILAITKLNEYIHEQQLIEQVNSV